MQPKKVASYKSNQKWLPIQIFFATFAYELEYDENDSDHNRRYC